MSSAAAANHSLESRKKSARLSVPTALFLIAGLMWAAAAPALASEVYAYGLENHGQLGNDYLTYGVKVPVAVTGLQNVTSVAAGSQHSLALKTDGTIWAWGYNQYGQLGIGSNTDADTPMEISGLSSAAAIAAGYDHSLALKTDGTVWAWGDNQYGDLGDGTGTPFSVPVQVSDLSNVTAIASGDYHNLALKTDGTVWTWGYNGFGQLGDGTVSTSAPYGSSVPLEVSGLTNVVAIAGGGLHSLAVKADGTVWTWGSNRYGGLGNGTTTDSSVPVKVSGLSEVIAVAGGEYHSLALKSDGTVWAWGFNGDGELGDGTTNDSSLPVEVSGLTNVIAISAQQYISMALKSDGTVWGWGGALGNGTAGSSSVPVQPNFLASITAIAAGGYHRLAVGPDRLPPTTTVTLSGPAGQNGWFTGPVSVNLTATDPDGLFNTFGFDFFIDGGGDDEAPVPFMVRGDALHSFVAYATDEFGDQGAPRTFYVPIDSTPPTLTFGAPSSAANAASWHNFPVTIPFSTADNVSGVASASPPSPLSFTAEGKDQTQSVKVTDTAGNSATFTSPMLSIDLTPPVTTAAFVGTPGGDGASYTGSVKVTLSATDNLSGVHATYYTVDGGSQQTYSQPFTVAADGTHVLIYSSVDVAGNAEPTHSANVTIDSTAPTLNFGAPSPAPNLAGWNNTTVTIPFTTADNVSGVASVVPSGPLRFTVEGKNQTQSVKVTDKSGNSATFTSPAVSIDVTPPTTTLAFSGPAGADSSSFTGPVQVKLSATDNLSGVHATYYNVDGGSQQTYSQPFNIAADGKHTLVFWSVDAAGNQEANHTQSVLVDTSIPAITITAPQNQVYLLNQVVDAYYTGADTEDGITTTTGTVPSGSPIDTASVGVKSFTVKATDTAGNSSQASVNYTVSYGTKLFYDSAKGVAPGQSLPISLELADSAGLNVSSPGVTLKAVSITRLGDPASPGAGTGPAFTYDPLVGGTGGYVFNLNTSAIPAGSFNINIIAGNDPTVHQAPFTIAGPTATIPAGISMVSEPFASSGDLAALFGVQVLPDGSADAATYDPVTSQYLLYPHLLGMDGKSGLPGRGYWVLESKPTNLPSTGPYNSTPLDITLSPGWNMIGDPFAVSVAVGSLQVAMSAAPGQPATQFVSEGAAISAGIMGGTIWAYDTTAKQYAAADTLSPFEGYWIYIDPAGSGGRPVTLRFTEPGYTGVPAGS